VAGDPAIAPGVATVKPTQVLLIGGDSLRSGFCQLHLVAHLLQARCKQVLFHLRDRRLLFLRLSMLSAM